MAGTHGGRYRKDKTSAHRHDTVTATKLLFDTAGLPFDRRGGTVAVMLCGSAQYRVPEVLVKIARHNGPTIDRERMGIRFDENEPIVPGVTPVHPDGIPYSGPAAIVPWWGASNHTAWQLIPLTLDTMQQYSLWDGELFQDYAVLRPFATTGSYALVQGLALGLAPAINMALLSEVNSYAFRTADYQLMSSQSHRPGMRSSQGHADGGAAGRCACVHHASRFPGEADDRLNADDDGLTASLPRSAQHENVAIHPIAGVLREQRWPGGFTHARLHARLLPAGPDEVAGRKLTSAAGLPLSRAVFVVNGHVRADTARFARAALRPRVGWSKRPRCRLGSASQNGLPAFQQSSPLASPSRTTAGQHPLAGSRVRRRARASSQARSSLAGSAPARRGAEEPISPWPLRQRMGERALRASEAALFDPASGTGLYLDTQRGERIPVRRR